MPHIAPVDLAQSDDAKADIEWLASATGFVANSMLTLSHRPEIAKAVLGLIRAVVRNPDGTVDPALRWMVAHVTSVANGCQYCSAHTFKNGADNGVPQDKLEALWEFETNPIFSNAERAALRVAVTGGQCPSYATPEDMAELRRHFNEAQIVEIGAVIALFGFNNRWNALMETDVEDSVTAFIDQSNYHGPGTERQGQT
ncbi:MAG: carboxymuconolactone decarboxylase family protein [Paracoccaceae bacterium]|nr:carboxymuconolactone decarboxylase family protein [Paracoccaceae bacterium]